jgi:hypothetical protein
MKDGRVAARFPENFTNTNEDVSTNAHFLDIA